MFRIDGALCEESVDNARDPTIIKRTFCSETHDEALKLNKWLNKGKKLRDFEKLYHLHVHEIYRLCVI